MSGNGSNGGRTTRDIVAKLWKLCDNLQGGGVSYKDYVNELTYLLFLKMLEETNREDLIPAPYRWRKLYEKAGEEQLLHYRRTLLELGDTTGKRGVAPIVVAIYTDAKTALNKPVDLAGLVKAIEEIDWFSAKEDGLGDLYEGLLEKTTSEKKSKAGQYFTPRPLIDCIVRLVKPQPGEVIQDPAAGTGGFLIASDTYIKAHTDNLYQLEAARAAFQRERAYVGSEFVRDTYRLCLMNLLLHGIDSMIQPDDSLEAAGEALGKAELVLTNPPFNRFPTTTNRADFSITAAARKGPMPFVEHVVRALQPGGRAAIVVPDPVLYDDDTGRRLRSWMMELCDVHTILRLPTGIFYAQGVKTNVLFLTRGRSDRGNTQAVWVYDLRANMPAFGKTRPLTTDVFKEFESAFGDDPYGKAARVDTGEQGRFRCFTREEIKARDDSLELAWLRGAVEDPEDELTEPEDIAAAILGHLKNALEEIEGLTEAIEPRGAETIEATA
ncbi:type I restriction enzyme M protein [Azospirillum brasilense]|uniref:site-specific DNA-methyltransferase (adenine-specific) n=1 Tax=Azospirillum brasilense TaxID=192 RepID=A0A560BM79_AZOBR|nr:N-6 DNA methylase [Azospirillum brasilense]TWA73725.1 type I restriction enzyme M protein [Azospirillum brasilense]